MRRIGPAALGIRFKLNLGVGLVVILCSVVFGSIYALIERAAIVHEKREHLLHMASMARLSIEDIQDADRLRSEVRELGRRLSEATGAPHEIRIEDAAGRIIVTSGGAASNGHPRADWNETSLWTSFFPATMSAESLVRTPLEASPARLIVEESLENLPNDLRVSLLRHLAFAAVLFGLATACVSLLAHFLIIRPVRELAAAAERIGEGGVWEPFSPTVRRRDEVGLLCDCFADLSRRLVSLVREERYGSAHLVALRVHRGLDEPVRYAEMELASLEALLPPESAERRHCAKVVGHLEEIAELSRSLKDVGIRPSVAGS